MSYLTENEILEIEGNVRLLSINEIVDISHYSFDSHIEEYNIMAQLSRQKFNIFIMN